MASSRPEVPTLLRTILEGDLRALANLITPANINSAIGEDDHTPLTLAAEKNKDNLVEYLMNHAALDLTQQAQGKKAVIAALNSCDRAAPLNRQAIMRILANKVFHEKASLYKVSILDPRLEKAVERINRPAFSNLFNYLRDFQSHTNYRFSGHHPEIVLTKAISTEFARLDCLPAARQWSNLQARELNDLLINKTNYLETLPANELIYYAPVMKLVVKLYQDQSLDVLNNNGFKIACAIAYLCAFKLGTLALINKVKDLSGCEEFFHDAWAMADEPDDKEEFVFDISPMDKAFLQAYTSTHNRRYHYQHIHAEKRLSKKLDYLVLLKPALELGSPEAKLEIKEQKELMAILLSEVIVHSAITRKEYDFEQAGLKYFYGIDCRSDVTEAALYFEKAAATHLENNRPNEALNAYLMSLIAHYQTLRTAPAIAMKKNALQCALNNFRRMLPLYSGNFAMPYHVEIFELLFDYIGWTKGVTEAILFTNLLHQYMVKIAADNVIYKDDLINHIFKKMAKSNLLTSSIDFDKTIATLKKCISSGGFTNIFYKKFDLLDQHPVIDKLSQAKRNYSVMKARVDVCMKSVDANLHDYEINISILSKALTNVKLLPALAVAAQANFDHKSAEKVYLLWGKLNTSEPEKYNGYKQAIELGNEFALDALLRMPPRRDYQISILRGLQTAILREDYSRIVAVHGYVSNREEFSNPLLEVATLAFEAGLSKDVYDNTLIAASKSYIPALLKLAAMHKELGHVRRSLYLAALLLGELILNKNHIEQAYNFGEDRLLNIINSCMLYLCQQANAAYHHYFCLAAWYIDFISAAQAYVGQDNSASKINVNHLLLYCSGKFGYYGDVRSAMVQAYSTADKDQAVQILRKPQHDPRFAKFYHVMQRLKDIQKITVLHAPAISYPEESVNEPHVEIEMVEPALKPANINRSRLFAHRIADIKPVVASLTAALEYKV